MKIAIVTDSTADLPKEILQSYKINIVPNLVIIGERSLEDGIDISRREFYEQLPEMDPQPTTATASSGTYRQLYQSLLEAETDSIISIHASSKLSGIYNAAHSAAQEFEGRIHVLDSETITMGLGFQVLTAAEATQQGMSLESTLERIEDVRRRVRVVAMLDTLEYVRRSGRVSWARARIGNLLRIKPFLEVKGGEVFSLGEARTRSKGVARLSEFLRDLGSLERLAVLHTNAEADARHFLNEIHASQLGSLLSEPQVVNVTTIIGTHVGPNGLGFAAVVE